MVVALCLGSGGALGGRRLLLPASSRGAYVPRASLVRMQVTGSWHSKNAALGEHTAGKKRGVSNTQASKMGVSFFQGIKIHLQ